MVGTSSGDIHVFGRPGVESEFKLPQPVDVRFLQFSTSTFNIVCLGERLRSIPLCTLSYAQMGTINFMFIVSWNMEDRNLSLLPGLIKPSASPQHGQSYKLNVYFSSITLSPSHTHVCALSTAPSVGLTSRTC